MASENTEVDRAFLARIPIFAGLPERVLGLIADNMRVVHVVPGAQLLREGEHARSMFVVRDGELQILKRGKGGTEYKLAVLQGGRLRRRDVADRHPAPLGDGARGRRRRRSTSLDLSEIAQAVRAPTSRRTRCWSSTSRARSAGGCASPTRCWPTWG